MNSLNWTEDSKGWRAKTPSGIHLFLTIEPDDVPVEGNAIATGDDAADKEYEDAILERLQDGDWWAWASVTVRAEYGSLEGFDYLGCCSYDGFGEFAADDGYLPSMVSEAIRELLKHATDVEEDIRDLRHKMASEETQ